MRREGTREMKIERRILTRMLDPYDVYMRVTLEYDPADPLAVVIVFNELAPLDQQDEVTWVIARDTLRRGMMETTGYGDVRVGPFSEDDELIEISITGLDASDRPSSMVFTMVRSQVLRFLYRVYQEVPRASEARIVDAQVNDAIDLIMENAR